MKSIIELAQVNGQYTSSWNLEAFPMKKNDKFGFSCFTSSDVVEKRNGAP